MESDAASLIDSLSEFASNLVIEDEKRMAWRDNLRAAWTDPARKQYMRDANARNGRTAALIAYNRTVTARNRVNRTISDQQRELGKVSTKAWQDPEVAARRRERFKETIDANRKIWLDAHDPIFEKVLADEKFFYKTGLVNVRYLVEKFDLHEGQFKKWLKLRFPEHYTKRK